MPSPYGFRIGSGHMSPTSTRLPDPNPGRLRVWPPSDMRRPDDRRIEIQRAVMEHRRCRGATFVDRGPIWLDPWTEPWFRNHKARRLEPGLSRSRVHASRTGSSQGPPHDARYGPSRSPGRGSVGQDDCDHGIRRQTIATLDTERHMTEHDSDSAVCRQDTRRPAAVGRAFAYRAMARTIVARLPWRAVFLGGMIVRTGGPAASGIGWQGERRHPTGGRVATAGVA